MSGPLDRSGISVPPSIMYGNPVGTSTPTPLGKLSGHSVESSDSGKVMGEKLVSDEAHLHSESSLEPTSLTDRSVSLGEKPTTRSSTSTTSSSSSSTTTSSSSTTKTDKTSVLKEIAKRDPTDISQDEISDAMDKIQDDRTLAKMKDLQNPQDPWDKIVDFFKSGRFLKLLPKAISGPIWSLIEEGRAHRNSDRMAKISEDAGGAGVTKHDERGAAKGTSMSLPHDLAAALSGHYNNKANKHSDGAMVASVSLAVSPLIGPLFAPIGGAVGGIINSGVGTAVQQGVSSGVTVGVKQGVQKKITQPRRDATAKTSEAYQQGAKVKLGEESTANSAKTARAFLKYLGMPPRENLLTSPRPEVREREEARLLLKRSMGAEIHTDYNQEVRTFRDQLEKMASEGRDTSLAFDGGSVIAGAGVAWDGEFSNDYLRRMMVSEGMISHSIVSEMAKERRI